MRKKSKNRFRLKVFFSVEEWIGDTGRYLLFDLVSQSSRISIDHDIRLAWGHVVCIF